MSGVTEEEKARFAKVHLPVREDWLALLHEEALEPELGFIDAHHHLWDAPRPRYLLDEFLTDAKGGHKLLGTVYVESRAMYDPSLPESERSLGETEFANGVAAMAASGAYGETRVCDGIVGYVDLGLGAAAAPILRKHMARGGRRFVGVRNLSAFDPNPEVSVTSVTYPKDLLRDPTFHKGAQALGELGLVFDCFVFHPQLEDVVIAAKACPDTPIVLDHFGGLVGVGPYRDARDAAFAQWRESMARIAECPNVVVKLGGFAMRTSGFGFEQRETPARSEELAQAWAPITNAVIALFGAERCMFESNFPVDKGSCSYTVLWNAYKRMTQGLPAADRQALFAGTAQRIYGLSVGQP